VVFGGFTVHFTVMGLQYTFGILFKAILDDKELQEASGNGGSLLLIRQSHGTCFLSSLEGGHGVGARGKSLSSTSRGKSLSQHMSNT
jgi:hypothetical protein